jgi:superfamily II DNA or RNA helicase
MPTTFQPHPFQLTAAREIYKAFFKEGHQAVLLVCPTGGGKTMIGSFYIRQMIQLLQWVIYFFAHRREIIQQTASKLSQAGLWPGIIMAGEPVAPSRDVQVASIQTYLSWVRRGKVSSQKPNLIVIDEAHGVLSAGYLKIVEEAKADGIKILGMTATPVGPNGRGLGKVFTRMVKTPMFKELVEMNFLLPPRYFVGLIPDLTGIKLVNGPDGKDYSKRELNAVYDNTVQIGDTVDNWFRRSKDIPTIAFAAGVSHSMHLAEKFRAYGVRAVHIDGETDKQFRDDANLDLHNGRIDMICNYGTHVEGTDIPPVGCIIDACATKSIRKYLQAAGRASRVCPPKKNWHYHDHSGNCNTFGPVEMNRPWVLDDAFENMAMNDRQMGMEKVKRVCESCGCLFAGRKCPHCGEPFVKKGEEMPFLEGWLEECTYDDFSDALKLRKQKLDADDQQMVEREWYAEALGWCEMEGKKPGMVFYTFQDKFKKDPPREYAKLTAREPSPKTVSYMKSRLIKNHYRKVKAAKHG